MVRPCKIISKRLAAVFTNEYCAILERKEIISHSIEDYCYIIIADNMEDAIDITNDIASEHLENVQSRI